MTFLRSKKPPYICTERMCHLTSRYITACDEFYRASPRDSTESNKHRGCGKAWDGRLLAWISMHIQLTAIVKCDTGFGFTDDQLYSLYCFL